MIITTHFRASCPESDHKSLLHGEGVEKLKSGPIRFCFLSNHITFGNYLNQDGKE